MPKRSRSGVVSRPARVVAPTSVNGGQVERHHARAGALADGDRQPAGPPSRDRRSPRARAARRWISSTKNTLRGSSAVRKAATSPLRSSAGPAVCTNGDVELVGDDLGERGLAEAGRAGEQHVVERLAARGGGLDRDRELVLDAPPGRRSPPARRGRSERSSSSSAIGSGVWMRVAARRRSPARAPRSARGDQLLGRLARRAVEQLVGLGGA